MNDFKNTFKLDKVLIPESLLQEYERSDNKLRLSGLKTACLLSLFLHPSGFFLDFFMYPDTFTSLLMVRIFSTVLILALFLVTFKSQSTKNIKSLGVVWALIINTSVAAMIFLTEGAISPYYSGINIVIYASAALLPWSFKEVSSLLGVSIMLYIASCVFNGSLTDNLVILFNNVFFIMLPGIICITVSHVRSQSRKNEFISNHQLKESKGKAEKSERLLQVQNKELEVQDRAKTEFVANINHEIRTPLTLIMSPIEIILRSNVPIPAFVKKLLLTVQSNCLRLLKLINDLLDVDQLSDENFSLKKQAIDLRTFLPDIVDNIRHLTLSKGLKIKCVVTKDIVLVDADAMRIEKVFQNLLTNAIKFTDEHGTIIVRVTNDINHAIIEVADDGIGIPENELPFIFDRFHQVDGSETRRRQGVGIGLSMVKGYVEKHEGKITVHSELDMGTTFQVKLKLLKNHDKSKAIIKTVANVSAQEPFAQAFREAALNLSPKEKYNLDLETVGLATGKTILVADDEPEMRRYIVSFLKDKYKVIQAADGKQTLDKIEKYKPELVLLDWMMPEMSGLKVCQTLRRDEAQRNLRIILLTAKVDKDSAIEALEAGANDFLTKPFSVLELQSRVNNHIESAIFERDLASKNNELETTLRQLKESEGKLFQSEKMNSIGRLAAGILHEINNPLNFMCTAINFAKKNEDVKQNNDLKDILNDIDQGTTRIVKIIGNLKTFAHPSSNDKIETFIIKDIFETAMTLVSNESQNINVIFNIEEMAKIKGVKSQLIQVLVNLLTNSFRAIQKLPEARDRSEVIISTEAEGDNIRIKIRDNGIGIKAENLKNIFDPFFTTSDVGEGTGLGLSLCHSLIKNHNGELTVKSVEGAWTEMSFSLPQIINQKELR